MESTHFLWQKWLWPLVLLIGSYWAYDLSKISRKRLRRISREIEVDITGLIPFVSIYRFFTLASLLVGIFIAISVASQGLNRLTQRPEWVEIAGLLDKMKTKPAIQGTFAKNFYKHTFIEYDSSKKAETQQGLFEIRTFYVHTSTRRIRVVTPESWSASSIQENKLSTRWRRFHDTVMPDELFHQLNRVIADPFSVGAKFGLFWTIYVGGLWIVALPLLFWFPLLLIGAYCERQLYHLILQAMDQKRSVYTLGEAIQFSFRKNGSHGGFARILFPPWTWKRVNGDRWPGTLVTRAALSVSSEGRVLDLLPWLSPRRLLIGVGGILYFSVLLKLKVGLAIALWLLSLVFCKKVFLPLKRISRVEEDSLKVVTRL